MSWIFTAPLCTMYRMKWYLISICFEFSWNIGFFKSWHNFDYQSVLSSSVALDQIVLQEVSEAILIYDLWHSASALLSATKVHFLPNQDIISNPKMKQHLKVLFISTTLHAQSESIYPYNLTSPPESYLRPYPIVPHRYLNTCFVATQWKCLGSTIKWHRVCWSRPCFSPRAIFNVWYLRSKVVFLLLPKS
jgi:hypothetical protein